MKKRFFLISTAVLLLSPLAANANYICDRYGNCAQKYEPQRVTHYQNNDYRDYRQRGYRNQKYRKRNYQNRNKKTNKYRKRNPSFAPDFFFIKKRPKNKVRTQPGIRYENDNYRIKKYKKPKRVIQKKKRVTRKPVTRKKSKLEVAEAGSSFVSAYVGGRNTFVFSPRNLSWYAYNSSGRLIRSGRASGGKNFCPDVGRRCLTPRGVFRVYSKGGPACKSSKYPIGRGGAPMPHCMFFHKGYAIHGSPDVPNHNASHGCIRVLPDDARWLSRNFMQHGTRVIVKPY